jgi:outer membrane protein OmpA-like peptidoglycan-associated protein
MPYPPATPTIEFKEVSMEESLITFSGDLLFDFDKWQFKDLKPGARAALLVAGYYIKWTSPRFIEIHGHTDSINRSGDANYNQRLSERRAKTVNDFLVSNRFIKPSGVEAKGYGAAMPVAPNTIRMPLGQELDNPDGRAQNRRVEIRLLDW